MKRNRLSDQQPTIDDAYIESLFTIKDPKKLTPKKVWVILGAGVLAVALLCLFLPSLLAGLFPGYWQKHTEEVYKELIAETAFHYTYQATVRDVGEGTEVTEQTEVWQHANSFLNITHHGKDHRVYKLHTGSQLYTREVTPEAPNAPWIKGSGSYMLERVQFPETLEALDYEFSRVRGGLAGVKVTYTRQSVTGGTTVEFQYDRSGKLTGVSVVRETPEVQRTVSVQYVFHDTAREETLAIFDRCRQEVEKIQKWAEE